MDSDSLNFEITCLSILIYFVRKVQNIFDYSYESSQFNKFDLIKLQIINL